jgi:phosphoribosylformimino-5-aminoimidazole carboxamide ribotide isomerase
MSFTVYPALDIRDGRVVRLRQGDYAQETRYADEPLAWARRFAVAGARWLHLVDLDAARAGGYTLQPLLRQIVDATGLQVQTGGGLRDEAGVESLLLAGATRVVVGSLALREPARVLGWLRALGGERVVLALDTRRDGHGEWQLPLHGWTESSGLQLETVLAQFVEGGLRHLLCTDIARDGMLAGPNLELYRAVVALAPGVALQASGGLRDPADVQAARDAGCAGAILGRALLERHFDLEQALAC